jgi:hypothetical protein
VRPYCDGKGYVSIEAHSNENHAFGDVKTWVRKDCPLCGGTRHLQGDTESTNS